MTILPVVRVALALIGLLSAQPALAQAYQIYPKFNEDDPNEERQWNPTVGQTEAACRIRAEFGICQAYYRIHCQTNGFPLACYMLNLSASNPQLFQQAILANRACADGDSQACAFLQTFTR